MKMHSPSFLGRIAKERSSVSISMRRVARAYVSPATAQMALLCEEHREGFFTDCRLLTIAVRLLLGWASSSEVLGSERSRGPWALAPFFFDCAMSGLEEKLAVSTGFGFLSRTMP